MMSINLCFKMNDSSLTLTNGPWDCISYFSLAAESDIGTPFAFNHRWLFSFSKASFLHIVYSLYIFCQTELAPVLKSSYFKNEIYRSVMYGKLLIRTNGVLTILLYFVLQLWQKQNRFMLQITFGDHIKVGIYSLLSVWLIYVLS